MLHEEDISVMNIALALSEMNEPPQMTFRSPKPWADPPQHGDKTTMLRNPSGFMRGLVYTRQVPSVKPKSRKLFDGKEKAKGWLIEPSLRTDMRGINPAIPIQAFGLAFPK